MTYYTIHMLDGSRFVTDDLYFRHSGDSPWSQIRTVEGEKIVINMSRVSYVKVSEDYVKPKSQTEEVVETTLRGMGLIKDVPKLDMGEHIDEV